MPKLFDTFDGTRFQYYNYEDYEALNIIKESLFIHPNLLKITIMSALGTCNILIKSPPPPPLSTKNHKYQRQI